MNDPEKYNYEILDEIEKQKIKETAIKEAAISAIPMSIAFECDILPISYFDRILTIGMVISDDKEANNEIVEKIKVATRIPKIEIQEKTIDEIRKELSKAYPKKEDDTDLNDVRSILQKILDEASQIHANDIYIEPASVQLQTGQIRYAVDGKLRLSTRYPLLTKNIYMRLSGYVYNQSDVQPQNINLPGDGRLTHTSEGREIDLRVNVLPMGDGLRSTNLRMLTRLLSIKDLQSLGMTTEQYTMFLDEMNRSDGFITIAGRTGEGKSTTAYSALKELDLIGGNIFSIENPIECYIDGLKQISIAAEASRVSKDGQMKFKDVARGLMRQYPQLVFLGEIRDEETLGIARMMSTTGIGLVATTHAHNAIRIILRYEILGATRQQITQTMTMAMSQRLINKLCPNCKIKTQKMGSVTEKLMKLYKMDFPNFIYTANKSGCKNCENGYNDRIGAFEILKFTPDIVEALVNDKSLNEVGHIAVENGFKPMIVSALQHMVNGDIDEQSIKRKILYDEALAYFRPKKAEEK